MTLRAAVFASGRGSNFQALTEHARRPSSRWKVTLLITDRKDAPVMDRARELDVDSAFVPADPASPERILSLLDEARIDFILLAGYLRLIPAEVVRRYRDRMINLHPALLPGFGGKGMYGQHVHEAILASGVRVSGVTVHLVDEVYDRGRILAQWPVPVLSADTPASLAARIHGLEHRLYPAVADELAAAIESGQDPATIPASDGHFQISRRLPDFSTAIDGSDRPDPLPADNSEPE